ncbi:hypothetical protein F2P81_019536 [Scophthalmus maximus]|uniref:Uncharacterized protein n=1 Tax=Scophthalmus maximus TaxID=52904 RepID=A0A6A4S7E5_SCOMX|nr:hypothetical protein F2P81_019536 [Scophthalmus maximus]
MKDLLTVQYIKIMTNAICRAGHKHSPPTLTFDTNAGNPNLDHRRGQATLCVGVTCFSCRLRRKIQSGPKASGLNCVVCGGGSSMCTAESECGAMSVRTRVTVIIQSAIDSTDSPGK